MANVKLKITRPTRADGKSFAVGNLVTVSEDTARALIGAGKAVPVEGKREEAPAAKGKGSK